MIWPYYAMQRLSGLYADKSHFRLRSIMFYAQRVRVQAPVIGADLSKIESNAPALSYGLTTSTAVVSSMRSTAPFKHNHNYRVKLFKQVKVFRQIFIYFRCYSLPTTAACKCFVYDEARNFRLIPVGMYKCMALLYIYLYACIYICVCMYVFPSVILRCQLR